MTYHLNSWPDWDEYYHEDNTSLGHNKGYNRYLRQTRDGMWWYYISPPDPGSCDYDWILLPEANSLEEAAAAADMIWRMR